MKITVLVHEKEQRRTDNTGQLIKNLANINCQHILWQRTQADPSLIRAIKQGEAVLLTQQGNGEHILDISNVKHLIVIDGTWQEARKIYNKSPYLKQAKWHKMTNTPSSRYNLRRNQIPDGLCTAECIIEALKTTQYWPQAKVLNAKYSQVLAADRSNQQK